MNQIVPNYLNASVVILVVAGALALSGCSSDVSEGRSDSTTASSHTGISGDSESEAGSTVVLGELASIDGQIAVGETIAVLVDLPSDIWDVTNSDDGVVKVLGADSSDDASIVQLVGIARGESIVVFDGEDDIRDEITVVVVDE